MFGISFAGVWKGLTAFFGFGEQVAKNINDTQQQDAGAAKQKAADQGAVLDKVTEAKNAQNEVAASGDDAVSSELQSWVRK